MRDQVASVGSIPFISGYILRQVFNANMFGLPDRIFLVIKAKVYEDNLQEDK